MNDAKSNQMQFRRAVHGICYKITAGIINKKKHKNISRIKRWQAQEHESQTSTYRSFYLSLPCTFTTTTSNYSKKGSCLRKRRKTRYR
jgi:hypothetical protein